MRHLQETEETNHEKDRQIQTLSTVKGRQEADQLHRLRVGCQCEETKKRQEKERDVVGDGGSRGHRQPRLGQEEVRQGRRLQLPQPADARQAGLAVARPLHLLTGSHTLALGEFLSLFGKEWLLLSVLTSCEKAS